MSDATDRLYSAPELAAEHGVTARALRFYESKGLLAPRRAGARRVYDHRDRARLMLILRGKRLGFSLAEIAEYLRLYDADPSQTSQLRRLAAAVHERIQDLEQQRAALECTLTELREIHAQTSRALRQRGVEPPPMERPGPRRRAADAPAALVTDSDRGEASR